MACGEKSVIIYILKDGLGNQLFEYSYAKKLAAHTGDDIAFCTYLYKLGNFSLGGTRHCSLEHFSLPKNVRILKGGENLRYFIKFMLRMLVVFKADFFRWFVLGKRTDRSAKYNADCRKGLYVSDGAFVVPPYVESRKRNKFVFGNYEGFGALPENTAELKKELAVCTEPTPENAAMLERIAGTESVCLHIRRGDYLKDVNSWLQVCDYDYYRRAVEYIKQKIENPVFYVFSNTSDDLEWIKENYRFDADLVYVNLDNPDYEELRLMSACRHFIISNSTFSWWAAVLGDHDDKITVAPEKWSNRENDGSEGMYNDEFTKI